MVNTIHKHMCIKKKLSVKNVGTGPFFRCSRHERLSIVENEKPTTIKVTH